MKKSEQQLFKVAGHALAKYGTQTLKEILENAAGAGEQSVNGIMNFPAQLKKEQADLGINVTIDKSNVIVSPPTVEPAEFAPGYARLPDQIKKYLERNLEGFPQLPRGQTVTLRWNNQSGIARDD